MQYRCCIDVTVLPYISQSTPTATSTGSGTKARRVRRRPARYLAVDLASTASQLQPAASPHFLRTCPASRWASCFHPTGLSMGFVWRARRFSPPPHASPVVGTGGAWRVAVAIKWTGGPDTRAAQTGREGECPAAWRRNLAERLDGRRRQFESSRARCARNGLTAAGISTPRSVLGCYSGRTASAGPP